MVAVLSIALALTLCDPVVTPVAGAPSDPWMGSGMVESSAEVFQPIAARGPHAAPGEPRDLSKRERWFRDKVLRPERHVSDATLKAAQRESDRQRARAGSKQKAPASAGAAFAARPGVSLEPITTLFNIWTREALPILPGDAVAPR